MNFNELTSNNINNILNEGGSTAKEGEKVIHLVSSRWDTPYRDEPAWADKYEGTAELYLCIVEDIDVEQWFGDLINMDEIPGLPAFIHYLSDGTLDSHPIQTIAINKIKNACLITIQRYF